MNLLGGKYHSSINTLPVGTFNKILETGELTLLILSGRVNKKLLQAAWEKVNDELIKEFGIPEYYERYLNLMKEACSLYTKGYTGAGKTFLTLAKVKQAQADEIISYMPDADFNKAVAQVSKSMGFRVNPNEITVREFYSYVKTLQDG